MRASARHVRRGPEAVPLFDGEVATAARAGLFSRLLPWRRGSGAGDASDGGEATYGPTEPPSAA